MAVFVVAEFTPSMLPAMPATVSFMDTTSQERKLLATGATSAVVNFALAALFSESLGVEVAPSKCGFFRTRPGDVLLLGTYTGPRLAEVKLGMLPAGGGIHWTKVQLIVGR